MWDDGQGAGAMGRYVGRWAGRGSDGEVYGAMGRGRERWEGIWGDRQGAGAMGRNISRYGEWHRYCMYLYIYALKLNILGIFNYILIIK